MTTTISRSNMSGSGVGVSGPAYAQAEPRPSPLADVAATRDGPTQQELRAAWRAYDGRFSAQGDADEGPLATQPGVPDLNIKSNRIRPIVNTGVDFLFGPGLTLSVADAEADEHADAAAGKKFTLGLSTAAQQAQATLAAVWGDDDQRMTTLSKLAVNGGVYGHVFVKVVEPRRGAPSLTNPPRLALLNPENVTIFTDPDDADLVTRFRIEYACAAPDGKSRMRKRQDITRVDPDGDDAYTASGFDGDTQWHIQNFEAHGLTGESFVAVDDGTLWPYPLPPIVDWQNYPNPNSHWGQRDVTDSLVALNAQLRLIESNINKIGFLQGHPIMWSTGTDTGGLKPTPGNVLDLGATDAKLNAVNAAGDLAQLMQFADSVRSDMDEESGIPGMATGRMEALPRGQVSGITMRLLYAPPLARTEHKRRLYGQGIRQVCQTALLVCGLPLATVQRLTFTLNWQDPLPTDDLAEAQTLTALQGIGFSQHTLIERAGGDPDVEEQLKADEQQAQMTSIYQGKALPPAPESEQQEGASEPEPSPSATTSAKGQQPPQLNPQHPAAVAARQKMSMMFGKAGEGKGTSTIDTLNKSTAKSSARPRGRR